MFKQVLAYGAVVAFSLTQQTEPPKSVVQADVPDEVVVGSSETMRFSLDVSELEGSSRLMLDLSEAQLLRFEVTESSQGTVDLTPDRLAIVWDEVKDMETLDVQVVLHADKSPGKAEILGAFSFLKDGVRGEVPIPRYPVAVASATAAELSIAREVEQQDADNFLVTLNVTKGPERGFLGLKEHLAPGFDAQVVDSANSIAQVLPGKKMVRFSWVNVESDVNNITVQYRLTRNGSTSSWPAFRGFATAEWRIENGSNNDVPIRGGEMLQGEMAPPVASVDDSDDSTVASADVDTPRSGGSVTGLVYKVQIAAGHNSVAGNYFSKYHDYDGEYHIDNHKGWIKYLEGEYSDYQRATDKKVDLRSGTKLPGPFVTAYHEGNRITVQEALMLGYQSN